MKAAFYLCHCQAYKTTDRLINGFQGSNAMLGNASISTIHSFCFDLIRDNINMLSLASDFRIIDETEENILKDSVLKDLVDGYYEKYPEMMEMLNNNFCGNSDAPFCRMILELYGCISSIPFLKTWLKGLDGQYDSNIYLQEYIKKLKNTIVCMQQQTEYGI